mgnify:CR=1 FL=1
MDSKLTIFSTDIMGSKGVRIDLGHSSEYVADGDSLTPAFEAGMMDALAVEISPLMAKINSTLDSLSVTVAGVNRLLSDSNQTSISRTLAHLENTLYNVSSLSRTINGKSAEIVSFISELTYLSGKLDNVVDNAEYAKVVISTKKTDNTIIIFLNVFKNFYFFCKKNKHSYDFEQKYPHLGIAHIRK